MWILPQPVLESLAFCLAVHLKIHIVVAWLITDLLSHISSTLILRIVFAGPGW